jgi:hypothetical protein
VGPAVGFDVGEQDFGLLVGLDVGPRVGLLVGFEVSQLVVLGAELGG